MRTKEAIREEIMKVRDARKAAIRKIERCNDRLDELDIELDEASQEGGQE